MHLNFMRCWHYVLLLFCICVSGINAELKITKVGFTNKIQPKQLIIVGTIDGKVSALDAVDGTLLWTVDSGSGPLISSPVADHVYKENGKSIRLIPSLQGKLFKFDGESLESVNFDFDQLLTSSFKFSSEEGLVGGKTTLMNGIDVCTGKILYTCSSSGCEKQETLYESNDVLIIKRQQHTIRCVNSRRGLEKWNFSVGEVAMDFSVGSVARLLHGSDDNNLNSNRVHRKETICENVDLKRIKILVPNGTVYLATKANQQAISWKHEFGTSITSAWALLDGNFQKINLFDSLNVPALEGLLNYNKGHSANAIYMGLYHDRAYIQTTGPESPTIKHSSTLLSENTLTRYDLQQRFKDHNIFEKSKPHTVAAHNQQLISNDSRANALVNFNAFPKFVEAYYIQQEPTCVAEDKGSKQIEKTSMLLYQPDLNKQTNAKVLYSYIVRFWKEIVIFAMSVAIILRGFFKRRLEMPPQSSEKSSDELSTKNDDDSLSASQPQQECQYVSRFAQDFEFQECLGKGGFGVVFKARNRMDDCSYAVKRILLPNSDKEREKVRREVRALAKLDHSCIVRYFNAWNEQPPVGWQETQENYGFEETSYLTHLDGKVLASTQGFSSVCSTQDNPVSLDEIPVDSTYNFAPKHVTSDSDSCFDDHDQFTHEWSEKSFDDNLYIEITNCQFMKTPPKYTAYQDSISIAFEESENQTSKCQMNSGTCTSKTSEKNNSETSDGRNGGSLTKSSGDSIAKNVEMELNSGDRNAKQLRQQNTKLYLYIQMQLCKKETLKDWLVSDTHSRDFVAGVRIFRQVVEAVKYIHTCNLIHRDLKPSNVLFSVDGKIKVGDFGLVTTTADEGLLPSPTSNCVEGDSHHTQQVGTRTYMAPEQMWSRTYTEKVDIFPLGLILFELVTIFETDMERSKCLSDARVLKFPATFLESHPQTASLARSMLSDEAYLRPSANQVGQHKIFKSLPQDSTDNIDISK